MSPNRPPPSLRVKIEVSLQIHDTCNEIDAIDYIAAFCEVEE